MGNHGDNDCGLSAEREQNTEATGKIKRAPGASKGGVNDTHNLSQKSRGLRWPTPVLFLPGHLQQ
jgi:hypothetical protein